MVDEYRKLSEFINGFRKMREHGGARVEAELSENLVNNVELFCKTLKGRVIIIDVPIWMSFN